MPSPLSDSPQTALPSQGRRRERDPLNRSRVQVYALVAIYCNDIHTLPAIAEFSGYSQVEVYYALRKLEALRMLVQIGEDSWAIHPAQRPGSILSQLAGLRPPTGRLPKPLLAPIQVRPLSPLIAPLYREFGAPVASDDRPPGDLSAAEIHLFRVLKRTAAVYLLLLRLNRPAGESEIARLLEIGRRTARSHLRALAEAGLVERTHFHAGWTLTRLGRQLFYFPTPSPQPGVNDPLPDPPEPAPDPAPGYNAPTERQLLYFSPSSPQPGENGPLPDPPEPASDPALDYNPLAGRQLLNFYSSSPQPGNNDPIRPLLKSDPEPDPEFDTPVWQALFAAGLAPSMRTRRLTRMPHLTPEYVRRCHRALLAHDPNPNPARLLALLETGAPAPEISDHPHHASCNCEACRRDLT